MGEPSQSRDAVGYRAERAVTVTHVNAIPLRQSLLSLSSRLVYSNEFCQSTVPLLLFLAVSSTTMAQLASFKIPAIDNEPTVSLDAALHITCLVCLSCSSFQKHYTKGSPERDQLAKALTELRSQMPFEVPCIINGEKVPIEFG